MRRFLLIRHVDVETVSGTGIVAQGVEFTDGTCALRWSTELASTAIYASIYDLMRIHGHNGTTVLNWVDKPWVARPHPIGLTSCHPNGPDRGPERGLVHADRAMESTVSVDDEPKPRGQTYRVRLG